MVEPLLDGMVLGLMAITLAGLFFCCLQTIQARQTTRFIELQIALLAEKGNKKVTAVWP